MNSILRKNRNINIQTAFKYLIFCSIILISILFISCGDPVQPVDNTYNFDSARYHWNTDTIHRSLRGAWAADTDYVFYAGGYELIIYNGYNYNHFPYNGLFAGYDNITGIDENHVYLGGADATNENYAKPKILIWNGTYLEGFIVCDTANMSNRVISILPLSATNIWMGTLNGRVYNYDGAGFHPYYFDTNLAVKPLFKDNNNNIYFTASRYYGNFLRPDSHYVEVRKFINNDWQIIYSKNLSNTEYAFIPRNLFNGMYAARYNDIHEFDGNNFRKVLDIQAFGLTLDLAGNTINDFVCWGSDGSTFSFYSWNGYRWGNENIKLYYIPIVELVAFKDYVYAAAEESSGFTVIYKGIKK